MQRGLTKAREYRDEIERLRSQVDRQKQWLDDPSNPTDDLWWQRKEIHDERWQMLEQDIGNLAGWLAIHLAEAGRYDGDQRQATKHLVDELYRIEQWMEDERLHECTQYPNGDDPIPF